jgi:hypothetical protein
MKRIALTVGLLFFAFACSGTPDSADEAASRPNAPSAPTPKSVDTAPVTLDVPEDPYAGILVRRDEVLDPPRAEIT